MPVLGIMTYGYDGPGAKNVRDMLQSMLGTEIVVIGASDRQDATVGQILEKGPSQSAFGENENKVLMLLGFDDDQVKAVLREFPAGQRPIFCGLTEENVKWDMETLVNHLLEEKKYWESRGKTNNPD